MSKIFAKYPKKAEFKRKVPTKAKKFVRYPQKQMVASIIPFKNICPLLIGKESLKK